MCEGVKFLLGGGHLKSDVRVGVCMCEVGEGKWRERKGFGVEGKDGFWDKGDSAPLGSTGWAAEKSSGGKLIKCRVKSMRGVTDDLVG